MCHKEDSNQDVMTEPQVSIVIPVYNGANYLREAIDSALAQTWPRIEVVVVNDGSRDDGQTERIARSYGSRIRYVAKTNGGVASALNAGIAVMSGDIFCWLSHDDLHLPEKAARQMAEWTALGRPQAVLYSDYRLVDEETRQVADVRMDHDMLVRKPIYALLRGAVHGCSVFIPRGIFNETGGFDESLPTTQDYDLWFRMASRFRFIHVPEILVLSRWHAAQGSKKLGHIEEATGLWRRMMDGISAEERTALEGTEARFYSEMAVFLDRNGLTDAARHAEARIEETIAGKLVSVVVPTLGRTAQVASALASIATQTHQAVEIILVDDGTAPEEAVEIAEQVARFGARLIRQENRGPAAARNAGWAAAKGEYVAFLDSDDLFLPEKLVMQLRVMELAAARLSHTSYWRRDTLPSRLRRVASGIQGGAGAYPGIVAGCVVATPTVMLRRDLWEEEFRFPEDLRVGEDVVLWIRIAARYGLVGLDAALSVIRTTPSAAARDVSTQARGFESIHRALAADAKINVEAVPQLSRLAVVAAAFGRADKLVNRAS
jgi:glycosyltransferase involved in cell wall biosynthesis